MGPRLPNNTCRFYFLFISVKSTEENEKSTLTRGVSKGAAHTVKIPSPCWSYTTYEQPL
jgi:hypothetical protein